MLFITGDTHGAYSRGCHQRINGYLNRFDMQSFPEQKDLTRNDYVIIAGDFGGVWEFSGDYTNAKAEWLRKMNKGLPNGEPIEEKRALDMLSKKSFTVLVVGGNHENYDRLELAYKEVDLCGGKAKKLRDNVYFLESGYIFNISGKKIFTFNGAASHDTPDGIFDPDDFRTEKGFEAYRKDRRHMMARTKYVSWWQQEMSDEECMTRGHHNLDLAGWKVDMIITHCLPTEAQAFYSHGSFKKDRLTDYLQDIAYNVTCPIWFSGHYHDNKEFRLDGRKYIVLYEQFIQMQ